MENSKKEYNLEQRTGLFGENILKFCRAIKLTIYNESLIKQLIRSATSIGANYLEANGASSAKDFRNKISICKKEAKETMHWLKMIKSLGGSNQDLIDTLSNECHQLVLIFSKIVISINNNKNSKI